MYKKCADWNESELQLLMDEAYIFLWNMGWKWVKVSPRWSVWMERFSEEYRILGGLLEGTDKYNYLGLVAKGVIHGGF